MVNYRGSGRRGAYTQIRFSYDEDAGAGMQAIEDMLLGPVFPTGYRSDVVRLLVRHWVEHPPDMVWARRVWREKLGEGWPDASASEAEPTEPALEEHSHE